VAIGRGVLRFDSTGKSGRQWKLQVEDNSGHREALRRDFGPRTLQIPGRRRRVTHGGFRRRKRIHPRIPQQDFSAKDFRTWAGTILAALALAEFKRYDSQAEGKRNVVVAIEKLAKQLGNTPAICRKSYAHLRS
jgi:DNA topoisomerase I